MITRNEFLAMVLPPLEEGEHYCNWGNKKGPNEKELVRQTFTTTIQGISDRSDELQSDNYNSFFGLAKYGPATNGRFATNAISLKSFFIDLDCGEGKPYATLEDGLAALKDFCKTVKLPRPTILRSGRGAHVYWILEEAMPRTEWKPHAERLKDLCAEHDFKIDRAVPADAARVLRVPYSNHVKDIDNPIPVEVLYLAPLLNNKQIKTLLEPTQDILSAINRAEFRGQLDPTTLALIGTSQSRFKTILLKSIEGTGCAQIAHIYTNQENLDEPLWRAGLSIAQHCVDRDKAIHAISSKYSGYSAEATEKKANETKGPYTCDTFKKLGPDLCKNCTLKIKSPIQLGREVLEADEEDNVVTDLEPETKEAKTYVIPRFPFPFFRGKAGGVFMHTKNKEGEDIDEVVYPYDFYVVKRMEDPDIGETILARLHLPKDGVRDFIMPLASVLSKEKFISTVASYGITALGKKQDALMQYVARWVEELQMQSNAEKAHKQFGWLEDESGIIIGDKEIRATEIVYSPPSSPTLPHVPLFRPKGDFHVWKDVINIYGREGMEYRAFAFFMGFGTLLMKFTALDGFLLNLVSRESGSGKTTILQAINSIYGRPKELLLAPKDTYNARMGRLGVMQSFAVTMDEITNMPPEQMSQQVYDVTSGRGKNRYKHNENAERANNTKWQTGLITSSNRYVTDALLSIKGFPDGELKRIMEIKVPYDTRDDATWARQHFGRLMDNYGHAIEPYSQALVGQLPMVKAKLAEIQLKVEEVAEIRNSERYWALMASLALTGGAIAKQLGLHDIPIKPVFNYAVNLIKETRERNREYVFDNDEFLGGFLQRHFHEILVINGTKDARTNLEHAPIREPRGALTARYEPDTKMLYVVTRTFREDCSKVMGNFEEIIAPYKRNGAMTGMKKKRMTAGTVANTQAPVNALCFDTTKLEFFNEMVLLSDEHNGDSTPD
jgi:energy-coupling factor transporter ATP-binding protein EcfA2